jgi:hypothetical protein
MAGHGVWSAGRDGALRLWDITGGVRAVHRADQQREAVQQPSFGLRGNIPRSDDDLIQF